MDTSGNVFVAENGNNDIKIIPFNGGSYEPAQTVASDFDKPLAISVDPAGRLYVLDTEYVWQLTP